MNSKAYLYSKQQSPFQVNVDGHSNSEPSSGNLSAMLAADQGLFSSNKVALPSVMSPDFSDDHLRYMLRYIILNESPKKPPSHDLKPIAESPSHDLEPNTEPSLYVDQLMQYLEQRREKPIENNINHWRMFVEKYFDPKAKKRWCFSEYDIVGRDAHCAFSHCVADSWNCNLCKTKSGRGFEAKYEILPRLCKLEYESADGEFLHLDSPCESELPTGRVKLQYKKAVQETVYKNARFFHEGTLCVIFTTKQKIVSWEFCYHGNKMSCLPRSFGPQPVQVSQNNQDDVDRNKSSGNLTHTLRATNNEFTEFGVSKQLVRTLKIAETTNFMADLFSFSRDKNLSPIASLNRYAETMKLKSSQIIRQHTFREDFEDFISKENNTASSSKRKLNDQL